MQPYILLHTIIYNVRYLATCVDGYNGDASLKCLCLFRAISYDIVMQINTIIDLNYDVKAYTYATICNQGVRSHSNSLM